MKLLLHLALLGLMNLSALCQGAFQNLGFEDADVSSIPPGQTLFLPFSQVFPGWVGYLNDTNLAATAGFNGISLGSPLISLISRSTVYYSNSVISGEFTAGQFTAVLSAGNQPPERHISAAIAQ